VDFLGNYEDLDYEGDGTFDGWHYQLHKGKLRYHLGSAPAGAAARWDTSWVPDQKQPMMIAARITDAAGLIYLTPAVTPVTLARPGISVELARPYDVPTAFTSCQYGSYVGKGPQTEKFDVAGDLERLEEARFAIVTLNGTAAQGFSVNDVTLEDTTLPGTGFFHALSIVPLKPLSALKRNTNTFTILPGKGRSSDASLPGVAVLLRYRK
jgi:hypothetical protein